MAAAPPARSWRSTASGSTRTLGGSEIVRNGSDDDPAYVIEQDDGARVLKLRSEVERVSATP